MHGPEDLKKTPEIAAHTALICNVTSMLVDADENDILIFPAIPATWRHPGLGFTGLAGRGGVDKANATNSSHSHSGGWDHGLRERTLDDLRKTNADMVEWLQKRGHFIESPDRTLYAYVNANYPGETKGSGLFSGARRSPSRFGESWARELGARECTAGESMRRCGDSCSATRSE